MTDKDTLTIAEIRQALGIGDEVMLADLLKECARIRMRADNPIISIDDFGIGKTNDLIWIFRSDGFSREINSQFKEDFKKLIAEFFNL